MSIFNKSVSQNTKARERTISTGRSNSPDGAISIIGPGMVIDGDIVTEGIVRVEGVLRGTVRAGKAVIVGHSGRIDGNIITEDAVVGGAVNGSIVALNRLELQGTCSVVGEIRTRAEHLKLEEGARFAGHVEMSEAEGGAAVVPLPLESMESDGVSERYFYDDERHEATQLPLERVGAGSR